MSNQTTTQPNDFQRIMDIARDKSTNFNLHSMRNQAKYVTNRIPYSHKNVAEKMADVVDIIEDCITYFKKYYEAQQNRGREEMTLPNQSTSGDSGKIALAKHEVPKNLKLDSTIEPEPEVVEKK